MSDPKQQQGLDSTHQALPESEQRVVYRLAQLRFAESPKLDGQKPPDVFAEALAQVTREQVEPEFVGAPSVLQQHRSFGIAAGLALAASAAALAALAFVFAFPPSRGPADDDAMSALPTWQSLKSSLLASAQRRPVPTLVVRDSSGSVNEPLPLGVSVTSSDPGATIAVDRVPAGAKLSVGKRISGGEWQVAAREALEASIIPPLDYVGVMNLTVELRGADGAALVSCVVRPTWTAPNPGIGLSASAATPPATALPQPAAPSVPLAVAAAAPVSAAPPPAAVAGAEPPVREMSADEVAGFVRRAQELLAAGDLQAARLLLLRAVEAHDARAALALAKTYDPTVLKQFGAADPEIDVAQARDWYRKAEEWGAPEARRELKALASYTR